MSIDIDLNERKYVAISIRHSTYDKSDKPVLWGGNGKTSNNEKRCFSGYCKGIDDAELYSLSDFQKSYGNGIVKCDEPVSMCFDYRTKYKKHDTVLVDIEELRQFLQFV